ncbi:retrovirus-related pol polyprotein from transposon TNT 1-94 [Tanacetum coccineum]
MHEEIGSLCQMIIQSDDTDLGCSIMEVDDGDGSNGDLQMGKILILRVYYVEGLGSRGSILIHRNGGYDEVSSLVLSTSKLKTKAWLFVKLKYSKYSTCAQHVNGKKQERNPIANAEPSTNEKLQMLYMDLYGPMLVESINKKRYILVIVDDYSRFTWVKFLRTKDEASEIIIKFLKQA